MRTILAVLICAMLLSVVVVSPAYAGSEKNPPTPMRDFVTGEEIAGTSAVLVRKDDHVKLWIKTKGLNTGHIYTFWWVLFEEGEPPAAPSSVFWGGYFIPEGDGGMAEIKVMLKELTLPAPPAQIRTPGTLGLVDAQTAEIHIPLVDHGLPQPGNEEAQKHTFEGGCGDPVNSAPCPIEQFVIFLP